MDKILSGSERHLGFLADLHLLIADHRKRVADALVPPIPLSADDITRMRGWICLCSAVALLYHNLALAFWLLLLALILDSVDGVVARRNGLDCPQTDRAMDIFTEFVLYAAYTRSYPGWVSTALMALWVLPKTLWIARYVKRRLRPDLRVGQGNGWKYPLLVLGSLQSFLFVHALLVLVFLQWVLRWNLP